MDDLGAELGRVVYLRANAEELENKNPGLKVDGGLKAVERH